MEPTRAVVKATAANRLAPTLQITATPSQPTQPAKTPRGRRPQRITAITRSPIRKSISPPTLRTTRRRTTTTAHLRSVELPRPMVKLTAANRLAPSSLMTAAPLQPTQPPKTPRCRRPHRTTEITLASNAKDHSPQDAHAAHPTDPPVDPNPPDSFKFANGDSVHPGSSGGYEPAALAPAKPFDVSGMSAGPDQLIFAENAGQGPG